MSERPTYAQAMRVVRIWLWTVFFWILAMVVVGGITRLTGSGLSMVEWRPLMGALPPMNADAWNEVFAQYQESPQYQQVNSWMQLEDFKRIFFWEYVHRLLGRLLGVVFALPWLAFIVTKKIRGPLLRYTAIALVLGGAQGLLGWVMVMSGLVDRPEVSHFRLAAHLSLALFVGQWILWILLNLKPGAATRATRSFRVALAATLGLLSMQIVWGAFMAGKRAGVMFATFPDMNGHYGPGAFVQSSSSLFDEPAGIHWAHRTLAWLVLAAFVGIAVWARREAAPIRNASAVACGVALVQVGLGALTVIYHVPIETAVLHQGVAAVLLSTTVWLAFRAGVLPRRDLSRTSASSSPR